MNGREGGMYMNNLHVNTTKIHVSSEKERQTGL
jgi:hypothetical protein